LRREAHEIGRELLVDEIAPQPVHGDNDGTSHHATPRWSSHIWIERRMPELPSGQELMLARGLVTFVTIEAHMC
jgi:hypothetical protein